MDMFELIPAERREYLNLMFENCAGDVRRQMTLRDVPSGRELFSAGDFCRNVYILLTGRVRAVDWEVADRHCHLRSYGPGDFLGEAECLAGLERFSCSAAADGPVKAAVIPSAAYMAWLKQDRDILDRRMQVNLRQLMTGLADARHGLLLNARERMTLLLVRRYEAEGQPGGILVIRQTREEFARELGLSSKTVDRNLRILEEQGRISAKRGGVVVTREQYLAMRQDMDRLLGDGG